MAVLSINLASNKELDRRIEEDLEKAIIELIRTVGQAQVSMKQQGKVKIIDIVII